jgi:beta-lactam-binding protein with PASTA domain
MKTLQLHKKLISLSSIIVFFITGIITFFTLSLNAQPDVSREINNLPQRPQNRIVIPQEILRMQQVTVPRLEGREFNFDEVVTILDRVGLQIGEVIPVANNERIGIITAQQPDAGNRVFPQTRVNISYGIERQDNVSVPNYIGLTVAQAENRMPNDRLNIGNIREENSEAPAEEIIEQFPEPEMEVDPGTLISFVVSLGPPPEPIVEVPSIVGESLREAAEILNKNGLTVGELIEESTDERPGVVLDQEPEAGTLVDINSPVNIVFSVAEPLITVPDVRNLSRNEAIAILKETGLSYLVQYEKNNDVIENTVFDQDPLPGNSVPPGADVLLIISERTTENWIFWVSGILVAAILGVVTGIRIRTGKKKKIAGRKNMKVDLSPKWDVGRQQILISGSNLNATSLHFKMINDRGIQTIKTD